MKTAAPVPPLMERQNLLEEAVKSPGPMSPRPWVHLQPPPLQPSPTGTSGQATRETGPSWWGSWSTQVPLPFPVPQVMLVGTQAGEDLPARKALQGMGLSWRGPWPHRGHRLPGKRGG